jgi:hypothetical protein
VVLNGESVPTLGMSQRSICGDPAALPGAGSGGRLRDDRELIVPGRYFRAAAVDFDGTLTGSDRPSPEVLAAIADTRADGRRVVLVTGRILAQLRSAFPGVDDHFDAIVAENGAVAARAGRDRALCAVVPRELDAALAPPR